MSRSAVSMERYMNKTTHLRDLKCHKSKDKKEFNLGNSHFDAQIENFGVAGREQMFFYDAACHMIQFSSYLSARGPGASEMFTY